MKTHSIKNVFSWIDSCMNWSRDDNDDGNEPLNGGMNNNNSDSQEITGDIAEADGGECADGELTGDEVDCELMAMSLWSQ